MPRFLFLKIEKRLGMYFKWEYQIFIQKLSSPFIGKFSAPSELSQKEVRRLVKWEKIFEQS
jgi:hypothetical protein